MAASKVGKNNNLITSDQGGQNQDNTSDESGNIGGKKVSRWSKFGRGLKVTAVVIGLGLLAIAAIGVVWAGVTAATAATSGVAFPVAAPIGAAITVGIGAGVGAVAIWATVDPKDKDKDDDSWASKQYRDCCNGDEELSFLNFFREFTSKKFNEARKEAMDKVGYSHK